MLTSSGYVSDEDNRLDEGSNYLDIIQSPSCDAKYRKIIGIYHILGLVTVHGKTRLWKSTVMAVCL